MKQKLQLFSVVLGLLLLFSCGNRQQAKTKCDRHVPVQLKLAAYNVEFSKLGTAQEIGEALKPYNFDVVCFSEAPGGDWTEPVGKVLGLEHSVVGKYATAGHEDKYKTIVSKTPLYGYEEVLMADTLHTATKAFTKIDGKKVAVYCVHFPFGWRDQAHIDETTGKITAFVDYLEENKSSDELQVVAGDLNFVISYPGYKSQYYEMFVNLGMDVSWNDLGIDVYELSTMGDFNRDYTHKGEVIDHIIYDTTKINAIEGQIIEMDKPLSDHKPVWALLELK